MRYTDSKYTPFTTMATDGLIEVLDKMLAAAIKLTLDNYRQKVSSHYADDANLFFQMLVSKCIYLRRNIGEVKVDFDPYIMAYRDPAVIANLTRQIYEAICTFWIVFILPDTDDKRTILHLTYLATGLRKKQGFEINSEEKNIKVAKQEDAETIERALSVIRGTEFYSRLDNQNRKKLEKYMMAWDFCLFTLSNDYQVSDKIKFEDMPTIRGVNELVTANMYPYLCAHTHSSYYSLNQFAAWYEPQNGGMEKAYKEFSAIFIKLINLLLSVTIKDYSNYFPHLKIAYAKLSEEQKQLIEGYAQLALKNIDN